MLLRPDSTFVIVTPAGERQAECLQCCHCGRHHVVESAIRDLVRMNRAALGYCARCNGVHCPGCTACVPIERQLENMEAARPVLTPSDAFAAFARNPLA